MADADSIPVLEYMRRRLGETSMRKYCIKRTKQLSAAERAAINEYPTDVQRPLTRGDCKFGERPCPWVSCSHHLYMDVTPSGSIRIAFPHLAPWELKETCALDVADAGGANAADVARHLGVVRERVRQMENEVLRKVRRYYGEYND